jgi:hypothetical protein
MPEYRRVTSEFSPLGRNVTSMGESKSASVKARKRLDRTCVEEAEVQSSRWIQTSHALNSPPKFGSITVTAPVVALWISLDNHAHERSSSDAVAPSQTSSSYARDLQGDLHWVVRQFLTLVDTYVSID